MSWSRDRLINALRRVPGYRAVSLVRGLLKGGMRRQSAVAQILRPKNLFQPHGTTSFDRYPEAFSVVRDALDSRAPRLLSFGCSTGEELLTLRQYFPSATIHGIDPNPMAIRASRALIRTADAGSITVARGGDAQHEPARSYDAVFAMAVFRHGSLGSAPPSCEKLLRFADFERTIDELATCLRPGGFLVIRHANFRFTDCAVAVDFELIAPRPAAPWIQSDTPIYDRANALVPGAARDDGVYRKAG